MKGNDINKKVYTKNKKNHFQEHFKASLLEQTEQSRRDATHLLDTFLTNGPFTSEWSAKEGLDYIAKMKGKVIELQLKDEQLNSDLSVFGLSYPESLELGKLESVSISAVSFTVGTYSTFDWGKKYYGTVFTTL